MLKRLGINVRKSVFSKVNLIDCILKSYGVFFVYFM